MTTLTVSATEDFTGDVLSNIDIIDFTNGFHSAATATFSNAQFGTGLISQTVQVDASAGANNVVVNGGSIDASGWTFVNSWGVNDTITLNGDTSADTITGSSQDDEIAGGDNADVLEGGNGADTILGGNGNDTFVVSSGLDVDAGEIMDGGAGTADTLRIGTNSASIGNFVGVLFNIEKLVFAAADSGLFSGTAFGNGAGLINTVTGASGDQRLRIEGASADLSDIAFSSWTNGTDTIFLNGTSGDDTLVGSVNDDTFIATTGTDNLTGGGGNDEFNVSSTSSSLGDTIDGGAGTGDVVEAAGDIDLTPLALLTGIEILRFQGFAPASMRVTGAQLSGVTQVAGGNSISAFTVSGSSVNLSSILFSNWDGDGHTITILGSGAANSTLTGSTQADSITGGALNDIIQGGDSNDTVRGAGGIDTIDGGNGSADVAAFTGSWLQYAISLNAGTYTLVDGTANRDGIDTVRNIETFGFSNGSFAAATIVNDAPIGVDDTNSADAVAVGIDNTASGNVLGNDTDADASLGDTKTVTGLRVGPESAGGTFGAAGAIAGTYGALVLNANGTYTYALNANDDAVQTIRSGQVVTDVFTYRVNDAKGLTDQAQLTVSITGTNAAPIITSDGGARTAALHITENLTGVTTVTASIIGGSATFAIAGGADASLFSIDAATGVLTFTAAPDFETPTDTGGDNVYDVIVRASDGSLNDDQAIAVTVANIAGHTIDGTKKADRIDGTRPAGNTATGEEDIVDGKAGNDTIKGAGGNDTIKGNAGNDSLNGETGNDLLLGGAGRDLLDGGGGTDTADFSDRAATIVLALNGNKQVTATVGGTAEDKLKNIENVTGGSKNDNLTGDTRANALNGNAGNDKLNGGKGTDSLDGGKGNDIAIGGLGSDTLTGGAGKDKFVFNAALGATNIDAVTDFKHDTDLLQLDDAIFKKIGPSLDAKEFHAAAGAVTGHDKNDRIAYDTSTGNLYYDADGKGGAASVLFATLTGKPPLDAGDFAIV